MLCVPTNAASSQEASSLEFPPVLVDI